MPPSIPPAAPGPPGRRRGPFGPLDQPVVAVRHRDGRWYPGRLHGWVRQGGGWRAVASYRTTPGIQFYAYLAVDDIRPAAAGDVTHRTEAADRAARTDRPDTPRRHPE